MPVASYHFIWILLLCCTADLQAHMLNEAPMDMVVAAESVYILGSSSITQLHRNLSLLNEAPLTFKQQVEATRNDALSMAIRENETELVVCFAYGKCFLFYMVDDGYCTDDNSFIASFGYPTNVLLTDIEMNSFYIAFRALDQGSQLRFLKLEQFSIDEIIYDDLYSDYYEEEPIPLEINRIRSLSLSITNSSFRDRIFINAFRLGNHVYFVGRDEDTDSIPKITLMRICDKGNQMFSTEGYDVYEIRLSCGPVSAETNITGVSVLDNTMVLGLTNRRYSRHCTFNLSRINMILDSAYDQCSSGDYDNPLPWAIYNRHSCTTFQEIAESRCNFGSPNQGSGGIVPALAVNFAAIGEVAVEVWNYSVRISLAVAADNVMLVYLAASNATGHYLLKYYSGGDSDTILVEEYEHSQPIVVLKQAEDHIYAATSVEVFRYKVFSDCSQYSSCDSCTAMKDPVCGWCVLENKCSRALVCNSSELIGRWINNQKQCIVNVSLSNKFATIEGLSNISFVTIPSTSVFPSLTKNESFTCVFTDIKTKTIHNLTVQDSACVGDNFNLTLLNTSFTQLSVRILSDNDSPSIEFHSNSVLTVFDCSQYKRCISCQHAPGCGWCVYDHKCTADSSTCRVPTDWRAAPRHHVHTHTCPILLKPPSGRYLQPVGVSKKLNLSTQHIPPPILGHKYVCRIRYLGKQSIDFDVEAKYTLSSMNISCQFKREQTRQLLRMTSGVGGAQLSLLYVDSNGTIKEKIDFSRDNDSDNYQMDFVNPSDLISQEPSIEQSDMLLYDCFQLGTSCSTCMSLRLRPEGFACGWCTSSGCTVSGDCDGTFYIQDLSGRFCPHPIIQSVSPSSGPIQGGTVVTITGDDLGIDLTSIESIMFGQHPCSVIANEYQPGRVIKCTTSAATDSETVHISLTVNRGSPGLVGATPIFEFHYENPTITSIYPRYGPISGGTLVAIEGSSLNTGDDGSAVISLAGQDCVIRSKTSERILCVASPNEADDGFIHISIDGANIYEGFYLYLPDPVIFSVSPSTTIESGGITLTFTGSNLNSTVKPTLLVFEDQQEYVGVCEGVNATALECKAPRLSSMPNGSVRRYSPKPLNYTIIMDNAPRPNTTNPELTLITKSDPVFVEIQDADQVYVRGSQEFIAILGRDINNVQAMEIAVSVDGLPCDNIILSQNVLRCKPPPFMGLSTAVYHANVKVTVGSGSLEYNVGVLEYIQDNSSMNVTMIIAVAMGSLLGIILMIFLVCTLVLSGRLIRKNCSKRDLEEVVNVNGGQNGQQEFSPPEYDYVSHENVYEDISDLAINTGREWPVGSVKNVANGRYQDSLQLNRRNANDVPNEEYIEMGGAHSLFQPRVAGAELPRLEVASRQNREVRRDDAARNDGVVERNIEDRQGGAMRRGGAARRDVARQDGVGATPVASGEYVDMLPPSLRMSRPTSSMQNPTQNRTRCILAPRESTPSATANVQNDENAESEDDRSIRVTKLRCALDL